jgi:hypothetical protein
VAVQLVVGFVGVVIVLYLADRVRKARAQTRRLHTMNDRLTAATVRADEQLEQREAAAQASADLNSFMPAIEQPPLTVPGAPPRSAAKREPGCERTGSREPGSARPGRLPSRTGEHPARPSTGEHPARPSDRAGRH